MTRVDYIQEQAREREDALKLPRKSYKKGENPLSALGLLPVASSSDEEEDDDNDRKDRKKKVGAPFLILITQK